MNWPLLLICIALITFFVLFRRVGQLSSKNAEQLIKAGAVVIDVRSAPEYNSGHLARAINVPLDKIEIELPKQIEDRSTTLLLHCQSGMRSSMAKKRLIAIGYTNVHNLGSFARAAELLGK